VFRRENSDFGVSTTFNNFIADLLFLSEVSHSLLPGSRWSTLRTPLFGEIGPGGSAVIWCFGSGSCNCLGAPRRFKVQTGFNSLFIATPFLVWVAIAGLLDLKFKTHTKN
jgi:hypothetical protein